MGRGWLRGMLVAVSLFSAVVSSVNAADDYTVIKSGVACSFLTSFDGSMYFVDQATSNLYKTDGTEAGTVLVKEAFKPSYYVVGGDYFFMAVTTSSEVTGLWAIKKGESTPTRLSETIVNPTGMTYANSTLFVGNKSYAGTHQLFVSDGTASGTKWIKDVYFCSSSLAIGNSLYFAGQAMDGDKKYGLWVTDGTTDGTKELQGGYDSDYYGPKELLAFNDALYFSLYEGLATCVGTTVSTVKSLKRPSELTVVGDKLVFTARDASSNALGIYASDGTESGTTVIAEGASFSDGVVAGGKFHFNGYKTGTTNSYGVWVSDGSAAGTSEVKNLGEGTDYQGANFTDVNGVACFSSNGALWKTDGSTATELKTDVYPSRLVEIDNVLYFRGVLQGNRSGVSREPSANYSLHVYNLTDAPSQYISAFDPLTLNSYDGKILGYVHFDDGTSTIQGDKLVEVQKYGKVVEAYTFTTKTEPSDIGGTTGDGTYPKDLDVQITAKSSATVGEGDDAKDYVFSKWTVSGEVTLVGSATATTSSVKINGEGAATAVYEEKQCTLTVATNPATIGGTSGGGTYSKGNEPLITALEKKTFYENGAYVTFLFTKWTLTGDLEMVSESSPGIARVRVNGDGTATAVYAQGCDLSVVAKPIVLACVNGTGSYPPGTEVAVSADSLEVNYNGPSEDCRGIWRFNQWVVSGDVTLISGETSLNATVLVQTGQAVAAANYSMSAGEVTTATEPEGLGGTSGDGEFDADSETTVRAQPSVVVQDTETQETVWKFKEWQVSGNIEIVSGQEETACDVKVNGHGAATAVYEEAPKPSEGGLVVTVGGDYRSYASVTPGVLDVAAGESVDIACEIYEEYQKAWRFSHWGVLGDGTLSDPLSSSAKLVVKPTLTEGSSIKVTAYLKENPKYEVSTSVKPSSSAGTITLGSEGETFYDGERVEVTATPASGYTFSSAIETSGEGGNVCHTKNPFTVTICPDSRITVFYKGAPITEMTGGAGASGVGKGGLLLLGDIAPYTNTNKGRSIEDFDPESDVVKVWIGEREIDCDLDEGAWKPPVKQEEPAKYTYTSDDKDPFVKVVLDFKKMEFSAQLRKADLSDELDNAWSSIPVTIQIGEEAVYSSNVVAELNGSWSFDGKKDESENIEDLSATMSVFSTDAMKVKAVLRQGKENADKLTIKSGKDELVLAADFEYDDFPEYVCVYLNDWELEVGPFQFVETDETDNDETSKGKNSTPRKIFSYNSGKDETPKVKMVIDQEKKFSWRLTVGDTDLSSINPANGVNLKLVVGNAVGGRLILPKIKSKYKFESEKDEEESEASDARHALGAR